MNKTIYDYLDYKPKRIQMIHSKNKIKLPNTFKNILTQPDFVEDGLNGYWNTHQDYITKWLGAYLKGSKVTYQDLESSGIERGFSTNLDDPKRTYGTFRANLRHPLGYTALPQVTPTNLGFQIWSESALRLRKTITSPRATGCLTSLLPDSGPGAIVEDHIAGSTASGAKIFKTYRDCGWDLDYILQEWLPNEIINYLIVLVRHEEHQFDEAIGKKGIPRGDVFSLDEKLSGKHYEHAGIPLPLLVTDERARIIR